MGDSFRDLIAWQKAMDFVTEVYRRTARFPERERYGLTNQLRRSCVSVPSNIAEGKGRISTKEFAQFCATARGSLLEAQTQIEIAFHLGYLDRAAFEDLDDRANEIGRILNGLITKLQRRAVRPLTAES